MNKDDLLKALDGSVRDLQQRMNRHFDLIERVLENRTTEEFPETIKNFYASRSREQVLKTAIREAIDTLEDTRKAFKSKTLEVLRKKLTQLLIDSN